MCNNYFCKAFSKSRGLQGAHHRRAAKWSQTLPTPLLITGLKSAIIYMIDNTEIAFNINFQSLSFCNGPPIILISCAIILLQVITLTTTESQSLKMPAFRDFVGRINE